MSAAHAAGVFHIRCSFGSWTGLSMLSPAFTAAATRAIVSGVPPASMRKPNRCASYLWQRRYGQLKVGEKAGKSDGEGEQRGRDTGRSMKGAERFTRWRSPRSAAVAV